jgi:hypothetical protein
MLPVKLYGLPVFYMGNGHFQMNTAYEENPYGKKGKSRFSSLLKKTPNVFKDFKNHNQPLP